jgi:pimeloyl-ACP methyl ester carboxylesterase
MVDFQLSRRLAEVEFSLDVHVTGPRDGMTALLLHGFPQHSGIWDDCLDGLHAQGLRTVTLDQRGYSAGPQPQDVASYSLELLADDALAVLRSVAGGQDHPAYLVGHDWGAVSSWALAAKQPELIRGLVAVSVPHPAGMAEAMANDPAQREASGYMEMLRSPGAEQLLQADGGQVLRSFFRGTTMAQAKVDAYVQRRLAPGSLIGPLCWYSAMAPVSGPSPMTTVPAVEVPTVFVSSGQDAAVSEAAISSCASWVTGPFDQVHLPETTHWIPDEQPQAIVDAVAKVISQRP